MKALPKPTHALIRRWAGQHRLRTGSWPHVRSGAVAAAPGGLSVAKLLAWQKVKA